MNKVNGSAGRIKIALVIGLVAALTGCLGVSGGGYYYSDVMVDPGPDLYLFGGEYYGRRDVHHFSQRGHESRSVAHSSARQVRTAVQSSAGQRGRR